MVVSLFLQCLFAFGPPCIFYTHNCHNLWYTTETKYKKLRQLTTFTNDSFLNKTLISPSASLDIVVCISWVAAHDFSGKQTRDDSHGTSHLHLSFLDDQLPVGISAHILKRVRHMILHHLLHLGDKRIHSCRHFDSHFLLD